MTQPERTASKVSFNGGKTLAFFTSSRTTIFGIESARNRAYRSVWHVFSKASSLT